MIMWCLYALLDTKGNLKAIAFVAGSKLPIFVNAKWTRSKYIGCESMVRFRYQSNKFIIASAFMVHNHLCNSEYVKKYTRAHKLNEPKLYRVKPVVSVSSEPEELSAMDVSYQKPATHDNRCTPVTQNDDIENYQKLKRKFCKSLDRYVSAGYVKEATAFLLSTFNQLKELKMNR
ncbi:unnamed protein product [Trichobilharzia szidati]|nr:unnamed protein product [Trichobilharzia szidati]